MAKKPLPKIEYLRNRLSYDPETGVILWKPITQAQAMAKTEAQREYEVLRFNEQLAGTPATLPDRRRGGASTRDVISVGGFILAPAHVAWALHYGEWPEMIVDHINRNPHDNRIENLRLATASQNAANKTKSDGKTSDYLGVIKNRGKWEARIKIGGQQTVIGIFDDEEQAAIAYDCAAITTHREFANPNIVKNPFLTQVKK